MLIAQRNAVIMLQMFIAVINENFNVAEESKRGRQADDYWAAHQPQKVKATWVRKLNPYRWFSPSPKAIVVENLPSNLVLPMQKALVQDYGLPGMERRSSVSFTSSPRSLFLSLSVMSADFIVWMATETQDGWSTTGCWARYEQVFERAAAAFHWRYEVERCAAV